MASGAVLGDAAECPPEGLRAADRDARGDQPVRGFQFRRSEPDRYRDQAGSGYDNLYCLAGVIG